MSVTYKDNWPFFEKVLGWLRYWKIRKYIFAFRHPVCVDIGCGFNGRFLRSIEKCIGGGGYGFDIRANEATYGRVRIINNSRYGGKLPLKGGKADCVWMLAVLEHLPPESFLIGEAVRVLKKAAILLSQRRRQWQSRCWKFCLIGCM